MIDQTRAAILSIGTAVPDYWADQGEIAEWMASSFGDRPAVQRLIRSLYAYSGIDKRHGCAPEYLLPPDESRFAPGLETSATPTTAERMEIYRQEAVPLAERAARAAAARRAALLGHPVEDELAAITHLVVVSCTGFFAPGLDFVLTERLGLRQTTKRTVIGFMGCSAAFNGLRTAAQTVEADPTAHVLVVAVELCSLHIQTGGRRDDLVSASLFADGAGAAIVGSPRADDRGYYTLDDFHTGMKPQTQEEMVWQIGNHGFTLRLSPKVPDHLGDVAPEAVAALMGKDLPRFWAIHPGGRAIVDKLQEIFDLEDKAVAPSRIVLAEYGNLSSATILLVLAEQQRRLLADAAEHETGVAMAFGPGLTIEMARLTFVGGAGAAADDGAVLHGALLAAD